MPSVTTVSRATPTAGEPAEVREFLTQGLLPCSQTYGPCDGTSVCTDAASEDTPAGGTPCFLERDNLLQAHLPDVRYIARRIHERLPRHVPFDDLVHDGVLGLIDAADKFDPGKQVQFRTYAKFRIRGAILDSLREMDWGPRSLRRRARGLEAATAELAATLGRAPLENELAEHLGIELLGLQRLRSQLSALELGSLPAEAGEDSISSDAWERQRNGPDEDPFFLCLRSEFRALLAEAMSELDERERRALLLYYEQELTMKEVGAALGVVESRVSQIHTAAMERLRARVQELLAGGSRTSRAAGVPSVAGSKDVS